MKYQYHFNIVVSTMSLILFIGFTTCAFGQKKYTGSFKDIMVIDFSAPFREIAIDYDSEELIIKVDESCKFLNQKKKDILAERIVPSSVVDIEFELVDGERVAKEIKTDIDEDGIVKLEGLLEAIEQEVAFVDGYKVKLDRGVAIVGEKKSNCQCKGMVYTSFKDPLLKPGSFFLEIKGKKNDQGIIVASEVEACKNVLLEADAKLRNAVEQSYNASGLSVVNKPANLPFEVSLPLHNGNIKIGQYAYKLLDDIRVQGYINSVGERVIPQHQKDLPEGDPNKLNFRFYVIDNPIPNAFAFPNGMIFVHTGILDIMENEAELAIVLGHEVAHVTHEHGREGYESKIGADMIIKPLGDWVMTRFPKGMGLPANITDMIKKTFSALRPEGLANVFGAQPARESQADRVGLQYALLAGYDIREATNFWNKMARITNEGTFKSQLNNNFRNMLASTNFTQGNPISNLGEAGFNVLAKMFLDTIYTSHPKSKARARALNQLILTGYKGEDLNGLDKGEAMFGKYVKGE